MAPCVSFGTKKELYKEPEIFVDIFLGKILGLHYYVDTCSLIVLVKN